jgi:hypothetical protein
VNDLLGEAAPVILALTTGVANLGLNVILLRWVYDLRSEVAKNSEKVRVLWDRCENAFRTRPPR